MLTNGYFPCEDDEVEELFFTNKDIMRIYESITDEYSRTIFGNRLLYSLTGDYRYICRIVLETKAGKQLERLLQGLLYIYGAGKRGKLLVDIFGDKQWQGFIDANKGGEYEGYPVYRLNDFQYKEDSVIIISNKYEYDAIKNELIKNKKVPAEKIIILEYFCEMVSMDRYFAPESIQRMVMNDQIFMDLGCYDGVDTIRALDLWKEENINVYAVEPDQENYRICRDKLKQYKEVTLINQGIGGKKGRESFIEGGEGARFSNTGGMMVEIDTIDNIVGKNAVGFIKMDIEGYEEEALEGGRETIQRCKPVLAVCIYHKRSDVWKLPLRILELNDNYCFYFGHYTLGWGDTVLYAIDREVLEKEG